MQFNFLKSVLLLSTLSLLTACGSGGESGGDASGGGEGDKTVSILGVVVGEQQEKLEAALAPFEAATGIDVVYEGTDSFATLLPVQVESGSAPDLAMFPQPGLMQDFARSGDLQPLDEFLGRDTLAESYAYDWIDLGSVDDSVYGVWYRASVKSLVWYNPKAFTAKGYEAPNSWDEMTALSDKIIADGGTPWCLGMESGDATGWVGTDWVEDLMLRTAGPDVYDQWTSHGIPFNSPQVKAAFEQFGEVALDSEQVLGGPVGVISTAFGDSPKGLFGDDPQCYLHRQANFISTFLPEDVILGEDVAVFPLPGIKAEFGLPVLVSGDVFGMFNDTPEARALLEYLTTPEPHEIWAGLGGFISPHKQVGSDVYPDPVTQQQAVILSNAETVRFDGSDLMPGSVGTGTFWSGVVDYVGGADLDSVLEEVEDSWPES